MKYQTIFVFTVLVLGVGVTQSYAAEVIFDSTEKSYSAGDIVTLEGNIEGGIEGDIAALEIKSPSGDVIVLRTVELGPDGSYSLKFRLPSSGESGTYDITTNLEVEETPEQQAPSIFSKYVSETETPTPQKSDSVESPTTEKADFQPTPSTSSSDGGGCLIATAIYGSELAPQVQQLREIRDNKLLKTESGTSFMNSFNDFYYSFSPVIADYERENPVFKEAVKLSITPLITSLSLLNHVSMDSESEVLGYGISLILLNIGMYVGIPASLIFGLKKKF